MSQPDQAAVKRPWQNNTILRTSTQLGIEPTKPIQHLLSMIWGLIISYQFHQHSWENISTGIEHLHKLLGEDITVSLYIPQNSSGCLYGNTFSISLNDTMVIRTFYLSQPWALLIHCLLLAIRTPGWHHIWHTFPRPDSDGFYTFHVKLCISECQELFSIFYIVSINVSLFTIIWFAHDVMQIFGLQVSLSCWCLTVQDSKAHHWRDCGVWRIPKYCYIIISIKPGTHFFKR